MGDLIAIVIIISVCVIGIFAIPISSIISQRRALKKYTGEEVEAADPVATPARVMSKYTDIKRTGSYKSPSHQMMYYVVFKQDDGEIKEFAVTPYMFEKCELYSTGMLVTVDGEFFDFGQGEEIQ